MNICGRFCWNPSTKESDIASCAIDVTDGQTLDRRPDNVMPPSPVVTGRGIKMDEKATDRKWWWNACCTSLSVACIYCFQQQQHQQHHQWWMLCLQHHLQQYLWIQLQMSPVSFRTCCTYCWDGTCLIASLNAFVYLLIISGHVMRQLWWHCSVSVVLRITCYSVVVWHC